MTFAFAEEEKGLTDKQTERHIWQERQKLEWDSYKQGTWKIGNHHQPGTGKEKLNRSQKEHGPVDTLILNL